MGLMIFRVPTSIAPSIFRWRLPFYSIALTKLECDNHDPPTYGILCWLKKQNCWYSDWKLEGSLEKIWYSKCYIPVSWNLVFKTSSKMETWKNLTVPDSLAILILNLWCFFGDIAGYGFAWMSLLISPKPHLQKRWGMSSPQSHPDKFCGAELQHHAGDLGNCKATIPTLQEKTTRKLTAGCPKWWS